MSRIFVHRVFAWIIDCGVIAAYAIILFLATDLFLTVSGRIPTANPYGGQLISFFTLTLPVLTYSYLSEKSSWKGTVGKRSLKLAVLTDQDKSARNILTRNVLKYLPWELAHTGIHWSVYYDRNGIETPLWTWVTLILPQALVFGYFASALVSKGESSIYDKISNTKIVAK